VFLDVHILVDPRSNVAAAHEISEGLDLALDEEINRPVNITIHIEPDLPSFCWQLDRSGAFVYNSSGIGSADGRDRRPSILSGADAGAVVFHHTGEPDREERQSIGQFGDRVQAGGSGGG
jgi:hypothetical protein